MCHKIPKACTKTTDYIRVDFRTTKLLFFLKLMKTIFQFNEKPRQNGRKKDKITESIVHPQNIP